MSAPDTIVVGVFGGCWDGLAIVGPIRDDTNWPSYRRADLPPTLAAALALPEIAALVGAARSAEQQLQRLGSDGAASGLTAALAALTPPATQETP